MDMKRRKELLDQWKNRRPEMGVITVCCKETGALFAGISKDTQKEWNGLRFKLSLQLHPNRQLQALWGQYGEEQFSYAVVKVLKYENTEDDQTDKLTALLEQYLEQTPQARRL